MSAYSKPEDPPTVDVPTVSPKAERKRAIARLSKPTAEAAPDGDPKTWSARILKIGIALGKPYLDALRVELRDA